MPKLFPEQNISTINNQLPTKLGSPSKNKINILNLSHCRRVEPNTLHDEQAYHPEGRLSGTFNIGCQLSVYSDELSESD